MLLTQHAPLWCDRNMCFKLREFLDKNVYCLRNAVFKNIIIIIIIIINFNCQDNKTTFCEIMV